MIVTTLVFIALVGIVIYKLVAWNWEKRSMIEDARDAVEEYAEKLPRDVADHLRKVLDMEPLKD
ncbi:MAG: hypothetical protein A3C93_02120 [Candidatus Lloydbacteria bacterium RIFCSPHIGHO2_02_FULL_54_17]|uniref:Uncharacterized protein n=1 Tax=Candidatus Lloydbacteria bacterium RIFCSPHIGHO2_02_FULL_54_17 TaxID=1798664 RepID=A0A1G2DKA8_9BACT|nr:MAG: hypothetical protein A2762_05670 [Candidatus Lloydbacteria bacterium RIFCSPHIGHO2_01_FULL_54_11]OGZ13248.1 MAG: hypothetical protein A3C93_02120 [Candidatus Lloydbacteria bacterium RIFCSPHIGHO2_02_FULL_54_17]OGZ15378.1 MAG: hypothetical protein A2948_00135 [Candidatus Lloydbacteria bacterium RIFCSPLOWO2_01_FULL_54_18]OGZ15808.1 MAG: hypothetical protein A3H76_05810 [Candidatus Lloydbacteria bacterium RIFCSPLOWO2_02_FULL_54_12]